MSLIAKLTWAKGSPGARGVEVEIDVLDPGMMTRQVPPGKGNYVLHHRHHVAVPAGSPWQTLKHSLEFNSLLADLTDRIVYVPHEDYLAIQKELTREIPDVAVVSTFFLGEMR